MFHCSQVQSCGSHVIVSKTHYQLAMAIFHYLGPQDIVAVKNLPLNQLSNLTTSSVPTAGVVGVVIDKQNLTDFMSDRVMSRNGTDTTLYLLDSNAFILWMSDNHSQAYGQPFAKYQPIVFGDMIDEGVFVAGTFAKHGPRPCCTCETNATCLDSAGFSIHKVRSNLV